jgi:subtilisin
MKRLFIAAAVFMFPVVFIGLPASAQEFTPQPRDKAPAGAVLPDRYIVELKAGENPGTMAAVHGVSVHHVYRKVLNGFAGFVPPGRLAALKADPRVLRVTPDREIHAIGKPGGGGGTVPGQVVPEGVKHIDAAPGDLPFTGAGVGVAVVDTGVDFNHTDLNDNMGSSSFSAFGGSAQDNNGHGTHVAGTIAAENNGEGVVGVAPQAKIYAVKVLDASGSGSDSAVIAGLDWVALNATLVSPQIKVVNMSLGRAGSPGADDAFHQAVKRLVLDAGVTVVVAAGNDASLQISQQVPSGYPEVIAVASTTAKDGTTASRTNRFIIPADTASYFTSDGFGVCISAPGEDAENITKAGFIQSLGILSTKLGGGTTRMSGTSMAAPHVAGVAALLAQKYSGISPDAVRANIAGLNAWDFSLVPLNSPTGSYSFDGVREGVLYAPFALDVPVP